MEPRRVKNRAQIALGTPKSSPRAPKTTNFEFFEYFLKIHESFIDFFVNFGSLLEVIFDKNSIKISMIFRCCFLLAFDTTFG